MRVRRSPQEKDIDPVIWPIIRDLNRLPWVKCTHNSCAGVGLKFNGSLHTPDEVDVGYFDVEYYIKDRRARPFHYQLSQVIAGQQPYQPHTVYRISWSVPGHLLPTTPQHIRADVERIWHNVHRFILRRLREDT